MAAWSKHIPFLSKLEQAHTFSFNLEQAHTFSCNASLPQLVENVSRLQGLKSSNFSYGALVNELPEIRFFSNHFIPIHFTAKYRLYIHNI